MAQKRSPLGRPQGTDGSDFSYRMTVDSRYVKVTKGKITLRYVIFIQVAIQLLGLLYLFIYPPKAGTFNLTLGAKLTAILLYSVGEIGRRHSSVFMLNIYKILAPLATLASNAVTAKHILDFKPCVYLNYKTAKSIYVYKLKRQLSVLGGSLIKPNYGMWAVFGPSQYIYVTCTVVLDQNWFFQLEI
ncbi:hypothetical protein ACHQM5_025964 [Ranunculus cassubicifolius]